ncbi:condensation domain-containing protein [Micromonospora sp. C95]|uniref:condensation domain-containing protein n=1 Tax=Micromonospora sp. C95 TaxID=2824882 RepID=UPI001B35F994|nr:condensation domain-containing protein [Micromonospora sp. C95]MBQ1026059.1 hypothetical protein [Micromonospora sp. C95]
MSLIVATTLQQEDWIRSLSRGGRLRSMPCVVSVPRLLTAEKLSDALAVLLAEHPALRTSFGDDPGRAFVHTVDHAPTVVSLDHRGDPVETMREFATRPFDLDAATRIRAGLLRVAQRQSLLVLGIDHLCADLASQHVIVHRLGELLRPGTTVASQPPESPGPYGRFADRQRRALAGPWGKLVRAYWREHFERWGPGRHPTPFARSVPGTGTSTARARITLPGSARAALAALARQHRTSRFVVMAAAILCAQARLSAAPSVAVSTDFHGRTAPGTADVVGLFSHGLRLPLERSEAVDLNLAVPTVRERLNAMNRVAVPLGTAASDWAREAGVTPAAGADLYLVTQPRPAKRPDDGLDRPDVNAFAAAGPDRLYVELAGEGTELALDVRMHTGTFDPQRVTEALTGTFSMITRAALAGTTTGGIRQ